MARSMRTLPPSPAGAVHSRRCAESVAPARPSWRAGCRSGHARRVSRRGGAGQRSRDATPSVEDDIPAARRAPCDVRHSRGGAAACGRRLVLYPLGGRSGGWAHRRERRGSSGGGDRGADGTASNRNRADGAGLLGRPSGLPPRTARERLCPCGGADRLAWWAAKRRLGNEARCWCEGRPRRLWCDALSGRPPYDPPRQWQVGAHARLG